MMEMGFREIKKRFKTYTPEQKKKILLGLEKLVVELKNEYMVKAD